MPDEEKSVGTARLVKDHLGVNSAGHFRSFPNSEHIVAPHELTLRADCVEKVFSCDA
jgi:hypothetical protein